MVCLPPTPGERESLTSPAHPDPPARPASPTRTGVPPLAGQNEIAALQRHPSTRGSIGSDPCDCCVPRTGSEAPEHARCGSPQRRAARRVQLLPDPAGPDGPCAHWRSVFRLPRRDERLANRSRIAWRGRRNRSWHGRLVRPCQRRPSPGPTTATATATPAGRGSPQCGTGFTFSAFGRTQRTGVFALPLFRFPSGRPE